MAIEDRRRLHPHRLVVSAWRGDENIAVISPAPGSLRPAATDVHDAVERLADRGVASVVTGVLHDNEVEPFMACGFTVRERLHLLRHDLISLPSATTTSRLRRAWWRDRPTVLAVDGRSFDEFWALDAAGLEDAVRATPTSRFRVVGSRRSLTGYAVTGRAGSKGYLQRLAVDPASQRHGIGAALVADGLAWLRRGGAHEALVNTQEGNEPALGLYRACGFHLQPEWLTVLTLDLSPPADRLDL